MKLRYKVMALASALAAATPAYATAESGGDSIKAAYKLGDCLVSKDRDAAIALMQRLPTGFEDTVLERAMLGNGASCLSAGSMSTRAMTLRGGIAQALLLRDFPRFGVEPKIKPHLFARFDLPLDPATATADARTVNLYRLADCVLRNQAIKTENLFRSGIGSKTEEATIDFLRPTMAACQTQGTAVRVNRDDLRSLLAQAGYNVSVRYWTGELWSAKSW